jgi:ketosteroid isomerase-like protein
MRCDPEGIVEAAVTAYTLGDYETAAAYYAPDATFALYADNGILPFAGEWQGRTAIVECWHRIGAAFDVIRFDLRNIRNLDGHVTCQIDYELCHIASGERLDGIARLILEVRDGQIVREREYNDVERMRAFMRFVEFTGKTPAEVGGVSASG